MGSRQLKSTIVIQGNPRESLKKLANDFKKQDEERKQIILETVVKTVEEEHPGIFFQNYEDAVQDQESKSILDKEKEIEQEIEDVKDQMRREIEIDNDNKGKRWKFYTWFGLFVLTVILTYTFFALYWTGELVFYKNA